MRARKKLNKRKLKTLWKLGVVLALLLGICLLIDAQIRPTVKTMGAYHVKLMATQYMNDAILAQLEKSEIPYDGLVKVTFDDSKNVTAVETNTFVVNTVKSQILDCVLRSLRDMEQADLKIPLGTLMGWQIFSARGPMVHFKMLPAGTVNTQIISQFEEAGINQTNHRIYLKIVCTVTGLIPGYPVNVEVENEFCLAETVVVGRVPESYTHVISDDSELISRLNDYGAQEQAVK